MANNALIATRVTEKYRKEVEKASRDKLRGNVVMYFQAHFAPLVTRAAGHTSKPATKKKAYKAAKKKKKA